MRFSHTPAAFLLLLASLLLACSPQTPGLLSQSTAAAPSKATQLSQAPASEPTAVVKPLKANLREQPSRAGAIVKELQRDDLVILITTHRVGPWYLVRERGTGSEGWVHGNTITLLPTKQGAATSSEQRKQATSGGTKTTSGRSYINVDGERVPSPVFSDHPPAGASARCRDGSYSFSRHRRGTCSYHGGVAEWLP